MACLFFARPVACRRARNIALIPFERGSATWPAAVRRIDSQGLLSPQRHPTPVVGKRLALADELFKEDVLILDEIKSRSVRYGAEQGPQLEIGFPDAAYLGVWTKPGAPFICIEPWQGITDPAGFSGDLHQKPGIFTVAPGAAHSIRMTVTLRGARSHRPRPHSILII